MPEARYFISSVLTCVTHHASQCNKCALDLRVVDILKQVVGLKYIMWLHSILLNGSDKITNIFQLQQTRPNQEESDILCDLSKIWKYAQLIQK